MQQQEQEQRAAEATVTTTTATDTVNLTLSSTVISLLPCLLGCQAVRCILCVCLSVCMFLLFIGSNSQLNLNFENVCTFVDRIAFSHPSGIKNVFFQPVRRFCLSLSFSLRIADLDLRISTHIHRECSFPLIHSSFVHSFLMCLCLINYIRWACAPFCAANI